MSIHECVIIPGLGGFVSRISSSWYDEETSTWIPPRKEITFNSSLFHNDGLLLSSYTNTYNISYSDAFVMVEKAVRELKKELSEKIYVQFGRIGTFKYDDNKTLLFSPAEDLHYFSTGTYGLFSIKALTLNKLLRNIQSPEKENKEAGIEQKVASIITPRTNKVAYPERTRPSDTIFIPLKIKKKFLYRTLGISAVVLLFMLLSTPIYVDTTHNTNYAKLLSPLVDKPSSSESAEIDNKSLNTNDNKEQSSLVITIPEIVLPKTEEPKEILPKETTPAPAATQNNNAIQKTTTSAVTSANTKSKLSGPYYIIIGSFPSEKAAQQFASMAKSQGISNSGILQAKDSKRIRVYADAFDNQAEANQYMSSFKSQYSNQHPNAWLFVDK